MLKSVRRGWLGCSAAALVLSGSLGCVTTESPELQKPDPAVVAEKQAEARYNMGIDHLNNGRTALAVREFLASLELEEADAWTHFALAEAYRRQGRTDDSVYHLTRSMELKGDFHSARLNLSGVYIQRGEFEKAAAECQILLDDPTFAAPWRALTNLGWAQFRMGDRETARDNLRMASQYNERYWPALLNDSVGAGMTRSAFVRKSAAYL